MLNNRHEMEYFSVSCSFLLITVHNICLNRNYAQNKQKNDDRYQKQMILFQFVHSALLIDKWHPTKHDGQRSH